MFWTASQRRGLAIVAGVVVIALVIKALWGPAHVSNPQPEQGARAGEVMDRIDPNTADWAALAALPVIGKSLAERIVAEREAYRLANPGQTPYRTLEDLQRVKGIGDATLQAIEPYLVFPSNEPPGQ